MTPTPASPAAPQQAAVDAALVVLKSMGLTLEDLAAPGQRPDVPTFADYVPVVSAAVTDGTRKAYGSYWNRVVDQWGSRRLDEPTPSEIKQLVAYVRANTVPRRNARGGRSAAENLIAALRCLYKSAEEDGFIQERDNPARKVAKPRRLPSTRRAVNDTRLAEINQVAATTGDDPELDTLILRLHTETACRRGGALALRPADLDREQCLIQLREKGETVRWQPVSPTLMRALIGHAEERHAPPDGRLLRYADGRPVTYRRYDGLWVRIGRHLPWVRTQQISTHWLRHTTLTWVERNFGFAIAHAYAGHTDGAATRQRHLDVRPRDARRGRRRPRRADRRTPPARRAGRERSMTALADLPVAADPPSRLSRTWRPRSRTGGGPRCGPGRGPLRDGPGPCEDHAVLAAAGPRRPRRGRGMVRLGRHRAEDRLRHGVPAAWHLVLASSGHSRHLAGRRRVLRRLRAARLARHRPRDQRPDPAVREAVGGLLIRARHGRAGRVPPHGPGQDHHGALGHHHPRVLPPGPGPGHGDRPRPHAARGRRSSSRPRTDRRSRTSDPRANDTLSGPAILGTSPTRIIRTGPPPSTARRARPSHRPCATAMARPNTRHLPLVLQGRASTTPAASPASLPEQDSTSPGGLCAAEGSKARTRRSTPSRLGSAPS